MIAPDQIYLPIYPTEDDCYVGDEWFLNPNPRAEDNIAYIRKDAILEWAKKLREEHTRSGCMNDPYETGAFHVADELIDHLNSL